MDILFFGGTRFMGKYAVEKLLSTGHRVTIANRGLHPDTYGDRVERIIVDRTDENAMEAAFSGRYYDVVCDTVAYCSTDVERLLDHVRCGRYAFISTAAVYDRKHIDTKESEFDALALPYRRLERADAPYDEIKRSAECAVFGKYPGLCAAGARFPFVIGEDDYTGRLRFYVEHVKNGIPMFIDNIDCPMSFVFSDEAGGFLAHLALDRFHGGINGASSGTVSLRQILGCVEKKCGKAAILSPEGEPAPYNGEVAHCLNTDAARDTGYVFSSLDSRLWTLIDRLI